jgi:uncharacterized protein YcbK (DUF882 family)
MDAWLGAPMRWLLVIGLAALLLAPAPAFAKPKAFVHVVQRGETLSSIAAHFNTNVSSICRWNGLDRKAVLSPGRKIGIPVAAGVHPPTKTKTARSSKSANDPDAPAKGKTWQDYVRIPKEPGTLTLKGYGESFSGRVLAEDGSVLPEAYAAINAIMTPGHSDSEPLIDRELIVLIVRVSDIFGGRPLRLISGYRPGRRSRHAHGAAMDFRIEGVPNWAVRDYALELDKVGVGYYPNSTHVHLDVRNRKTSWVDLSRPGQRARYVKPKRSAKAPKKRHAKRKR